MLLKNKTFLYLFFIASILISSCKKEKNDGSSPVACMETPDLIEAGTPAAFSSICSENLDSAVWTFGDGGTTSVLDPTYTYTTPGTFTVTLTVFDENGESDATSEQVVVDAPEFYEHSGNITEDEIWVEGLHVITGDVYVRGAILTIMPGAIVKFNLGNSLNIGYYSTTGSTLIAEGTDDKKITFTSSSDTKSPGDWGNIGFYDGNSNSSSMKYCVLEYAGGTNNRGTIHIGETNVAIENSEIKYSDGIGISLDNDGYFDSFINNKISETGSYAITINANYVHTIGAGNDINTTQGIAVSGGRLEESEFTWKKQTVPYVVTGDIYLGYNSGSKLTIEPGTQIHFTNGRGLYVGYYSDTYGTLIAEGTSTERIKFSSAAVEKSVGDWEYIGFYEGASSNSSLKYCDIEYGGSNSLRGMIYLSQAEITIENCNLSNSEFIGVSLDADSKFASFTNNEITNVGTYEMQIFGNAVHTLGSNNSFSSGLGIEVKGDRIEIASGTWLNHDVPYVITGDQYIGSATGTEISIEPGTTVSFSSGRGMYIGYYSSTFGKLIAQGNSTDMITFTSAAPEGSKSAGSWDYLGFYDGTSSGSILDYCTIEYGGSSRGNIYCSGTSAGIPTISNCTIKDSGAYGINVSGGATPTLSNNTFVNNASGDTNM